MIQINHKWMIWLFIFIVLLSSAGCSSPNGAETEPVDVPGEMQVDGENLEKNNEPEFSDPVDAHHYVLYLKHREQAFIFSDTYSIQKNDPALADRSLAEYVIEQLIRQRGVGELINPIHPQTKLLSLEQDGRKAIVNLSGEFVDGMTGTSEDTEATIAMVVNSLITLPGIDQVTLMIEGEIPETINELIISEVYAFITEYYPDK
ncbi:MAG: GerMN domain-containing protein [Bacillota bacterium]|nr:GerMN domain-containing protein [Bacillota bacterium]MDW7677882.1 GerMN domain-containing protein [Bacillota bacterium]